MFFSRLSFSSAFVFMQYKSTFTLWKKNKDIIITWKRESLTVYVDSMQQMVAFGLLNPLASTSSFNVLPNFHKISFDQNCWFCQMSNKYSPLI